MAGSDTVVFIPAWNEETSLPAVLDELRTGLPRGGRARDRRRLDRPHRELAAAMGATVVSFGENRGLRAGIAAGYREAAERGYAFCGRVDADGQHPSTSCSASSRSSARTLRRRGRLALRLGRRLRRRPVPAVAARRFGIGLLQKAMHVRLGTPFHDPTSGMAAVNRSAMPVMASPT